MTIAVQNLGLVRTLSKKFDLTVELQTCAALVIIQTV